MDLVEESGAGAEEASGAEAEEASGMEEEEASGMEEEEESGMEEEEVFGEGAEEVSGEGAEGVSGMEAEEVSGIEGLGVTHGQWFIPNRRCHEISLSNSQKGTYLPLQNILFTLQLLSSRQFLCVRNSMFCRHSRRKDSVMSLLAIGGESHIFTNIRPIAVDSHVRIQKARSNCLYNS